MYFDRDESSKYYMTEEYYNGEEKFYYLTSSMTTKTIQTNKIFRTIIASYMLKSSFLHFSEKVTNEYECIDDTIKSINIYDISTNECLKKVDIKRLFQLYHYLYNIGIKNDHSYNELIVYDLIVALILSSDKEKVSNLFSINTRLISNVFLMDERIKKCSIFSDKNKTTHMTCLTYSPIDLVELTLSYSMKIKDFSQHVDNINDIVINNI